MSKLYLVQAFAFALSEPNHVTFEEDKSLWWIEEEDEEKEKQLRFSISLRFFYFY